MNIVYAVFGVNGLGTTQNSRFHYNELNRYRNLHYDGTLKEEQFLFTKGIKAYMLQKIPPIPFPYIFLTNNVNLRTFRHILL